MCFTKRKLTIKINLSKILAVMQMNILYNKLLLDPEKIVLLGDNLHYTTFIIDCIDTYNKLCVELNNSLIKYTDKPLKLIPLS